MNQDAELQRFKMIAVAGGLFLMSAFFSFGELRFAVFGQEADGQVSGIKDVIGQGRRSRNYRAVEYSFTEADGTARRERDDVPLTFEISDPQRVKVQYLPGVPDSSRLAGNSKQTWLFVFVGSLVWVAWTTYGIVREGNAGYGSRRRGANR